ncbi:hypothetical protein MMC07_005631 [Pseudocyphellaria aurata]|nr:hypothetical protein [Pseudocyphellaria aurata]
MFSDLPAEIHAGIAEQCGNNELINLCLTSRLINERCLRVLYRCVDLQSHDDGPPDIGYIKHSQVMKDEFKRQLRFLRTLSSHPEYGRHVRCYKGTRLILNPRHCPDEETAISEKEFGRVMQSLTHVQSWDIGSRYFFTWKSEWREHRFPVGLFRSATSVRLAGHMRYCLPKSILNAINPATLGHLCLSGVQDYRVEELCGYAPGDIGEDGRIVARGTISGLLTGLTGRCTSLRTLILQRFKQDQKYPWQAAAEDASCIEWASFIGSVQGTVEEFTFEQRNEYSLNLNTSTKGDERFLQFIFPVIVSGSWPCLTILKLHGVKAPNGLAGKAALLSKMRAALVKMWKLCWRTMLSLCNHVEYRLCM